MLVGDVCVLGGVLFLAVFVVYLALRLLLWVERLFEHVAVEDWLPAAAGILACSCLIIDLAHVELLESLHVVVELDVLAGSSRLVHTPSSFLILLVAGSVKDSRVGQVVRASLRRPSKQGMGTLSKHRF